MRDTEWVLTYNHLDNKPYPGEKEEKFCVPFELYDDDGILYFSGYMTENLEHSGEEIFDPLDYAMAAWGCTELRVRGEIV